MDPEFTAGYSVKTESVPYRTNKLMEMAGEVKTLPAIRLQSLSVPNFKYQ